MEKLEHKERKEKKPELEWPWGTKKRRQGEIVYWK